MLARLCVIWMDKSLFQKVELHRGEEHGPSIQTAWLSILSAITCSVDLGKLLKLSMPQFFHRQKGTVVFASQDFHEDSGN